MSSTEAKAEHPAISAQAQADASTMTQQAHADAADFKEQYDEGKKDVKRVVKEVSTTGGLIANTADIGHRVLTGVLAAHPNCAEALKGARGVVILQAAFAAVGITSLRGQGYVIANNHGTLSPPSFIHIGMLGAGLSVGGEMIDAIEILYTQADLDQYKAASFKATELGKMTGAADVNPSGARGEDTKKPALFTTSTGVMLNYSFTSGHVKVNVEANADVYGKGVAAADILEGKVDKPQGLEPFYSELSKLMQEP